jgi:hypothetical protein
VRYSQGTKQIHFIVFRSSKDIRRRALARLIESAVVLQSV